MFDFSEKFEIKTTKYYHIISKDANKALCIFSNSKSFKTEKALLDEINPSSLSQIWQIVKVNPEGQYKKGTYEFVHTRSTLVLEKLNKSLLPKFGADRHENN
jgi:hypothetical protein